MTTGIEPLIGQRKSTGLSYHARMIGAIARKDIIESLSNTQLLLIGLMPVLIFLLYRLMVSGVDNSSILDIAIYDMGSSHLVTAMSQYPGLELHIAASDSDLQAFINDETMSGLLIPDGFDEAVAAGEDPDLTIWLNPHDGLGSETIAWQRFMEAEILKLGQQSLPAQIEWVRVDDDPFGADTALTSYLLITVLTLVFFMTGVNVIAMLITEEKEKKTAVMLINSPANLNHIVWGKVLAGTLYIVVVSAIVILLNGGLSGNWPLVLLYMLLSLPVSLGIGIVAGSTAQSTKQCQGWLGIGMIFFLAPAWFSTLIELPAPFDSIVRVLPSNFLVRGLNDALNHTAVMAGNTINLTGWTAFMLVIIVITAWRIWQKPQSIIT
jgi:ABC-type Na+ efflux pump permease subunit